MSKQQPVDRGTFDVMVKQLRLAETHLDLKVIAAAWMMDLSVDRADICLALHDVEIEKGWH